MKEPEDQLLVIFGASGDLTLRKLLPALYELHVSDMLPDKFAILGAARTVYTDEQFREISAEYIIQEKKTCSEKIPDAFLNRLFYVSFDSESSPEYRKLNNRIGEIQQKRDLPDRILFYLATPPVMYELIPRYLYENDMNKPQSPEGWRRLIVEKPFGSNLESAEHLSTHLRNIFNEKDIYRIDHYLGKETVQNILVLRFSNGIFEPLWNRNYIDSVEISASETLGIENRGKYYDNAGALRDMIQNHLMQLMAFVAMESPSVFEPEPIRDEIVKVFRAIRPITEPFIDRQVIRAQYEGYRNEKSVEADSTTETWVGMQFFIDNWRWSGVPFYFYTGKKQSEKKSEIIIHFKSTPHQLFAGQCSGTSCNQLSIRVQPNECISLRFGLKIPGAGFQVKQVSMDFNYSSLSDIKLPDAYERLLLDAMFGDSTLYTRSDALEASWKFIDPILNYWEEKRDENLYIYPAGYDGPAEKFLLRTQMQGSNCSSI